MNQAQLEFAIKAKNEAEGAFKQVRGQVADMGSSAQEAENLLASFGDQIDALGNDVQGLGHKIDAQSEAIGHMSGKLDNIAEGGGNAEQALRGVSDMANFLGEQFGVNIGPVGEYGAALADLGGGIEGALKGGPALLAQLKTLPAAIAPAIASAWAHVTALLAEAAAFIAANAPMIVLIATLALVAAGVVLLVQHWGDVVDALRPPIDYIRDTAIGVFEDLKQAPQDVLDWVKQHWPEIATIISGPFAPLVILATDGFGIRSALIGAFGSMVGEVTGKVSEILEAGQALGSALKDGFIEGVKGTVAIASNIADGILDAIKYLINSAVDAINDLIPNSIGFDVGAFGVTKHISIPLPDNPIPHLAKGGIVMRPTLALIGEAGPEAVVPLSRGGGIGGVTEVHIHGSVYGIDDLMYQMDRALKRAGQAGLVR